MLALDATTKTFESVLGSAVTTTQLPIIVTFTDVLQSSQAVSAIASSDTQSNGTSTVTIVAAPASGSTRVVKTISIENADSASATVTVRMNDSATLRVILKITLAVGYTLHYEDAQGWYVTDGNGAVQGTGPAGATGPPGATGPAGNQGFAIDGDPGDDALMIPGAQGPAGNPGATGPQGQSGVVGLDGIDGDEGMPIPGPPGPTGATGATGATGPQGFSIDGDPGEDALMIPGAQGPQGNPGPAGSASLIMLGLDGEPGEDGLTVPSATTGGTGGGGGADFTGAGVPQGSQTAVGGQTYRDTTNGVLWIHLPLASSNTGWYVMNYRGTAAAWQINQFLFTPIIGNTGVNVVGNVLGISSFNTNGTVTQTALSDAHGFWLTDACGGSTNNTGFWQSFTWDCTQDFDVVWKVRTGPAVTSVRYTYYICTGDPSGDNLGGTKGFGFRFSTNASDPGWVGVNGDGTTQHVTGSLASVSASTLYILRMRRVGTTVFYSANDGAETSVTANIPTGTVSEISLYVSALTASGRQYDFGSFGGHIGSFSLGQ